MNIVDKHIKINNKLAYDSDQVSSRITVNNDNEKHMLFVGFYRTALSHFTAINLLIQKKLYASAFALMRVLFESIVRGLYSYLIFDDPKILIMYQSDNWDTDELFRGKLLNMCEELDAYLSRDIFKDIKERVYERMCDYTHTGATQIARNFNEEKKLIEPNFEDSIIIDALEGSNFLFEMISTCYLNIGVQTGVIQEDEVISLIEENNEHRDIKEEQQQEAEQKEVTKPIVKDVVKKLVKRPGLRIVKKGKDSA